MTPEYIEWVQQMIRRLETILEDDTQKLDPFQKMSLENAKYHLSISLLIKEIPTENGNEHS